MRFVIFFLGLRRRQLAPDLSNAQFILSTTNLTELASARTLQNSSRGLWGVEVLFAALCNFLRVGVLCVIVVGALRFVIFCV